MTEKRIFDAIDIDWSSCDVWDAESREAVASFIGTAVLSADFIDPEYPDDDALTFNLYVPMVGDPYISWVSILPPNIALGEETLEAVALDCIDPVAIERERRDMQAHYTQWPLEGVLENLESTSDAYEELLNECEAIGLSYAAMGSLGRIGELIDSAAAYTQDEINARGQ